MPVSVSYSRDDSQFGLRLTEDLKQRDLPIWWDQVEIAPGVRWDRAIQKALDQVTHVLLVMSHISVEFEISEQD